MAIRASGSRFSILCGAGLVLSYALLGAAWLVRVSSPQSFGRATSQVWISRNIFAFGWLVGTIRSGRE